MTSTTIVNAAPLTILRGTQDLSTKPLVREPEAIPSHLPKVYIYAQKGPTDPRLVVGDTRTQVYGADSFDVRKKWANHATVLSNMVNAEGNAQMIERVLPADIGPESNILLSLDVLPTSVPDYQRNIDGSYKLDAVTGNPLPTLDTNGDPVTVPGFKVKWVVSNVSTILGIQDFGKRTIGPGDQLDAVTAVQSQRYPVLEFKASSAGAWGNDVGVRIWAPDMVTSGGFDSKLMSVEKVYPYRISVIKRSTATATPKIVENNAGEQFVQFSLKKGVISPSTDTQMYMGDIFLDNYQNVKDVRFTPALGDFGSLAIYDSNITALVNMFYAAEKSFIDANIATISLRDFTGATGEQHLFNFVSGAFSDGYLYHSFQLVSGTGSIKPNQYLNIFAKGGSDGTMDDTAFAALVSARVTEYNNPNSQLLDSANNVESIIYDSGFPLATKKDLCSFLAIRKDSFVVLSTHTVGNPALTASEEQSTAIALRTYAQNYPESDYYGTPVCRALVMGRSGLLRGSQFTTRVPATLEVAQKAARYMGAADGKWKNGYHFDGAPGSILNTIYDVNIIYTPANVRNNDWDAGLNWVQSYDRRSLFIPALKTVYNDDTSVLNSFFTAMAIVEINKVCERAWRQFSGVANLTNAQLIDRVNAFIIENTRGRFDERFIIEPNTYFTEADLARGYSWTTAVKIFSPSMKTVMSTFVQAYRISDYGTTA